MIDAARRNLVRPESVAACLAYYPRVPDRAALTSLLSAIGDGVDSYLEWIAVSQVFIGELFTDF